MVVGATCARACNEQPYTSDRGVVVLSDYIKTNRYRDLAALLTSSVLLRMPMVSCQDAHEDATIASGEKKSQLSAVVLEESLTTRDPRVMDANSLIVPVASGCVKESLGRASVCVDTRGEKQRVDGESVPSASGFLPAKSKPGDKPAMNSRFARFLAWLAKRCSALPLLAKWLLRHAKAYEKKHTKPVVAGEACDREVAEKPQGYTSAEPVGSVSLSPNQSPSDPLLKGSRSNASIATCDCAFR